MVAALNLNVPEKIVLVLRQNNWNNIEGYKQAFIVDPSNREQLNKAREWAKSYEYTLFDQRTKIVGKEVYLDNKDFKMTLLECADSSSQGGKLSFWNCLIEKDGLKTVIGIEQNNLLSILKQSTVLNGVIKESVSLVKLSSTGGVIHNGMQEWQNSKQIREAERGPLKKTCNWKLGKSYMTPTLENTYMCDLFCWFDVVEKTRIEDNTNRGYLGGRTISVTHYHIKMLDKPKKLHLVFDNSEYSEIAKEIKNSNITTLSKLFATLASKINELPEKTNTYAVSKYAPLFEHSGSLLNRFPSRELGKYSLEVDDYFKELKNYIEQATKKMYLISRKESYISVNTFIKCFGYSVSEDFRPILTDEDKRDLLQRLTRTVHIDFGDGYEVSGNKQ